MTEDQFKTLLEELSATKTLVEGTDLRVRDQGEKLDRIEARVSGHDKKLDRIEARQERAELRLGSHDEKLDRIEGRQVRAEAGLSLHDEKLDRIEARQGEQSDKLDALKLHFDVVGESLVTQLQIVAEGTASLGERMERSFDRVAKELSEQRAMSNLSFIELSRRIHTLEASVEVLQARLTRLETSAAH